MPDKSLIDKILHVQEPTDKTELASFFSLINYYGRFIPNFSELCAPLFALTSAEQCSANFEKLERVLNSDLVPKPFSLEKRSTLAGDASKHSIGAVLLQHEHPVLFT